MGYVALLMSSTVLISEHILVFKRPDSVQIKEVVRPVSHIPPPGRWNFRSLYSDVKVTLVGAM